MDEEDAVFVADVDPFDDDRPLVCSVDPGEACEACQ